MFEGVCPEFFVFFMLDSIQGLGAKPVPEESAFLFYLLNSEKQILRCAQNDTKTQKTVLTGVRTLHF
jgi:hypothetical protein